MLAGLTLAAAILFAIVCIVLAMVYRKQANRLVQNSFSFYFDWDFQMEFLRFHRAIFSLSRSAEENLKSNKHTQLPTMAVDCQIEQKPQHTRTTSPQLSSLATSMGNNCTGVNNNDTRHHQIISDQEPPDGDETDPDVIPNQYGKSLFSLSSPLVIRQSNLHIPLDQDNIDNWWRRRNGTKAQFRFYAPRLGHVDLDCIWRVE